MLARLDLDAEGHAVGQASQHQCLIFVVLVADHVSPLPSEKPLNTLQCSSRIPTHQIRRLAAELKRSTSRSLVLSHHYTQEKQAATSPPSQTLLLLLLSSQAVVGDWVICSARSSNARPAFLALAKYTCTQTAHQKYIRWEFLLLVDFERWLIRVLYNYEVSCGES